MVVLQNQQGMISEFNYDLIIHEKIHKTQFLKNKKGKLNSPFYTSLSIFKVWGKYS